MSGIERDRQLLREREGESQLAGLEEISCVLLTFCTAERRPGLVSYDLGVSNVPESNLSLVWRQSHSGRVQILTMASGLRDVPATRGFARLARICVLQDTVLNTFVEGEERW